MSIPHVQIPVKVNRGRLHGIVTAEHFSCLNSVLDRFCSTVECPAELPASTNMMGQGKVAFILVSYTTKVVLVKTTDAQYLVRFMDEQIGRTDDAIRACSRMKRL